MINMGTLSMSFYRAPRILWGHGLNQNNRSRVRQGVTERNESGFRLVFQRCLSSGEVFTALKPFFFAVHPDFFSQFPKEREINENSLKKLNAYIESATHERAVNPTHLTFYLRQNGTSSKDVPGSQTTKGVSESAQTFKAVGIELGQKDVRRTVYTILEKCNLPTSYIDSIPKSRWDETRNETNSGSAQNAPNDPDSPFWTQYKTYEEVQRDISQKKAIQDDLETWLNKNAEDAKAKLSECWPIREEMFRLKDMLCKTFEIQEIIWDCGWGARHFRGCLESFQALVAHHPELVNNLRGRTLIFGRESGVSMEGHVILNSGEVRRNWLDIIKNVGKRDAVILRIPSVQKALSKSLKDIKVVHRKFEPQRLAENYVAHLRKLTTALGDYRGRTNFPKAWPENLSHLELVVETDAGPLMVSPTGQIIVPSSCPPFLLVNFISDHMEEAKEKLDLYKGQKYEERDLHAKCIEDLGLVALEKADNVTPSLMISCCSRLLSSTNRLAPILRGTHLWITTYYSVLSEGEICIPWNWKDID